MRPDVGTLADVAAAAGVSPSTASRALADSPQVNSETRERVWKAARRLAFEPNQIARWLRTRSSRLVGMLLPDVAHGSPRLRQRAPRGVPSRDRHAAVAGGARISRCRGRRLLGRQGGRAARPARAPQAADGDR